MPRSTTAVSLLCLALTTACMPKAYRIDVRQGNIINPESASELRRGMNKQQVLALLGTPVQQDILQDQRWYYVYSTQKSGTREPVSGLVLHFDGDSLSKIQPQGQTADTP